MKRIELNKATCKLLEVGLINLIIKNYVEIDAEDMIEIRKINEKLTHNNNYVVLFETGLHSTFTKDARELVSSFEYGQKRKAIAILIDNLSQRIVGNFFININKPSTPTKIFTSKKDALQWLKTFL